MVVREIEPRLLQLLHQTGVNLEELLLELAEEQTACILSKISTSMRTLQMFSLFQVFDFTVYALLDP